MLSIGFLAADGGSVTVVRGMSLAVTAGGELGISPSGFPCVKLKGSVKACDAMMRAIGTMRRRNSPGHRPRLIQRISKELREGSQPVQDDESQ